MLSDHARETTIGFTILALAVLLRVAAPAYFTRDNLSDLFLANLPVLIIALGMTLVILTGEIDISVGSVFAVCGVVAGTFAKWNLPMALVLGGSCIVGGAFGALNGYLVGYRRIPSIVVTLAMMIASRDALRWVTQGAWVQGLPQNFQWLALSQQSYPVVAASIGAALVALLGWALRYTPSGRAIYLTGSDADVARLVGVDTSFVKLAVFTSTGALTGLAALTFIGVTAYWERAIQGGIILVAVMLDATRQRVTHRHDVAATA
jgi:rhamnose transport system permease protein